MLVISISIGYILARPLMNVLVIFIVFLIKSSIKTKINVLIYNINTEERIIFYYYQVLKKKLST